MEEGIDLRQLIQTILNGKKIIAGMVLVCIFIVAVYSYLLSDPIYQAKVVLSINQSTEPKTKAEGLEGIINDLTGMTQVSAESYAAQVKNPVVLQKTMERIGVDFQASSVSTLANQIEIINIKGTDLLEITVDNKNPKMSATVANSLAEVFTEYISNASRTHLEKTNSLLREKVDEEQAKIHENIDGMKSFLQQSPSVVQLNKELETNLSILSSLHTRLVEYEINADGLKAAIQASERELAKMSAKVQLKKSLVDDSVNEEAKDLLANGQINDTSEEINPAYVTLVEAINQNKSNLALYEKQIVKTSNLIKETEVLIEKNQVELVEKKIQANQIEGDFNTSLKSYDLLRTRYTEYELTSSLEEGKAIAEIVSPAHEPLTPVRPKGMQNIAVAAMLGLMMGICVVLLKNYMSKSYSG